MESQTPLNRISRWCHPRMQSAYSDHKSGIVATLVLLLVGLLLLGWPILAAGAIHEGKLVSERTSREPQNDLCADIGTEVNGSIIVSTIWSEVNSPYHVTDDVTVRSGSRLTIEPGVVVCFAADKALHVGTGFSTGQLVADGEIDKPITFTADDASPGRGFWMGLEFSAQSQLNSLSYCVVEYAGTGINANDSDSHSIDHCTFRYNGDGDDGFSSGGAIHVYGDGTSISFNEIHDNEIGIRFRKSNENYIVSNQIHHNDGFGIGLVAEGGHGGDTNLIESNQIYNNGGNGVSLDLGSNNQILKNEITNNAGNGIWVQSQSGLEIVRNIVRANVQNGLVYAAPNSAPTAVHSNILCSNFAVNLLNLWSTELKAEGNWFGTNTPNVDGKIGSLVDFDPWIQMDVALNPASLPADGTSTAQFQLTMDDGGSHAVPDGYIVYAMPSQGSLASTVLTLNSGLATTTYTAGTVPGKVHIGLADDCKELDFFNELTLLGVDLAIAKKGPGEMTWPGQRVTYTIGISELKGIDTPNVVVTDELPIGATWVSDTGADCGLVRQETAPDVVWTKTQWDKDDRCWFDVTVEVGSEACPQGRLENSVLISSSIADDDPSNNRWTTSDDSPTVACLDLAVRKEDGAGLVPVLHPEKAYLITYTLTYTNEGYTDATGVVLSDTIPPGTRFYTGGDWTCDGDECRHTIGSLPVGGPHPAPPLVVQVLTPTLQSCDSLLDSAAIGDDGAQGPDLEPEDNKFDLNTSLPCLPDLVLAKTSDAGDCVFGGQRLTYALTYANVGLAGATGVLLTETVPANTTYAGSGWVCDGDTCTRAVADVPKGGSGSVEFAVQVDELLPDEVIVNEAQIGSVQADIDPRDNEILLTTPVCESELDLLVTKTDGGLILGPNKEYLIEYTITASNKGEVASTGVVLTDVLPLEATYKGTDWACTAGECSRHVGTLDPSATVQVTLPLQLEKSQFDCPVTITNTVRVTDDGAHGADRFPSDNAFTSTTTFECLPDLVVVLNDNVGPSPDGIDAWIPDILNGTPEQDDPRLCVSPGERVTYTVGYVNTGLTTATQVVLTETLPEHTSYVGAGWNCLDGVCTHLIGTLPPDTGGALPFTVRVNTVPSDRRVENEVRIGGAEEDLYPADNVSTDDTPICDECLQIRKIANPACAFPGDQIRYTIMFTNTCDMMAPGIVLTETVPAYTSHLPTPGWLPLGGKQLAYEYGPLGAYSGASVEFMVVVDDPLPDLVTETVNVVCIASEYTVGSVNCASLTTPLPLEPDLRVVKHDHIGLPPSPNTVRELDRFYRTMYGQPYHQLATAQSAEWAPVKPGDVFSYTVTYLNLGRRPATGVVLTETLPEHTSYVGYGWTHIGGNTYTYQAGDLGVREGGQKNFWVQVGPVVPCGGGGYLYNWVHIAGNEEECNLNNNWSGEETAAECVTIEAYLPLIMKAYVIGEEPTPSPTPAPTPTEPPEEEYVKDVAVNPETNRVYISSPALDSVLAVDPTGVGSVIASIPVGKDPIGLAVVTSTNKIYAANFNSWTVTAIQGSDHTPITSLYVGAQACKVASDSGDARVYVANHLESQNGAAAIDSQTDQFEYYYSRLHAAQGRYGIDVDPEAEKLFIAARDSGLIAIQDAFYPLQEPQIIKLDPPRVPYVVAFNPTTNHLFVTAADDNRVVVLAPYSIQWSRGKWTTWLGQRVFILDQANAGWIKEIPVGLGAEEGIAVNPRTGYVYVTNAGSNTVSVLKDDPNPALITFVKDIAVGEYPQGVDVDVNTHYVYVANADSQDLTVIDGNSQTVVKTIPLD